MSEAIKEWQIWLPLKYHKCKNRQKIRILVTWIKRVNIPINKTCYQRKIFLKKYYKKRGKEWLGKAQKKLWINKKL